MLIITHTKTIFTMFPFSGKKVGELRRVEEGEIVDGMYYVREEPISN